MPDLKSKITDTNGRFMDAFGRGDAPGVAAFYTSEGEVLPPGATPITGHEGIAAFWSAVFGMGITSARLDTAEVDDLGDTAIEIGRYTLGTADGQTADEGKYLVVWKNENGRWKLHRDIWNTSLS